MTKVGVIGEGWVGKSMMELFPDAVIYDEPFIKERATNPRVAIEAGRTAINACDVAFVCVPTNPERLISDYGDSPTFSNGRKLDTSIVEEVVDWCESDLIIIRSTVNPGTCDKLESEGKNIVFMPEYLGETVAHPLLDDKASKFLIVGGKSENRRKAIELFQGVYNANIAIRQVTNLEAEVIKLSENRAIAFKVLQAQELYDACETAGVDYYTIREAVYGDDPRFNRWFTFVYPDKRGANSKCIPKDVNAWAEWAEDSELTDALLKYNERLING